MSSDGKSDKDIMEAKGGRVARSPVRAKEQVLTRAQTKRVNEDKIEIRDANTARGDDTTHPTDREFWEMIVNLNRKLDALEKKVVESSREGNDRETSLVIDVESARANEEATSRAIKISDSAVLNARLPRGGWLKNPFEDIKYFGKTDKQNPLKFIGKFEKIVEYENVGEIDQIYFFARCMRGAASTWFEVREPDTIEEAKKLFIQHFWNKEQQARFREEMYTGRYNATGTESMSEYALNIMKQAKCLDPPMSDTEIIRCVKRHFGNSVAREIRPTTVRTVEDFVQLLDEIEIERERSKKLFEAKKRDVNKDKIPAEKKRDDVKKPWNKNKIADEKKSNRDDTENKSYHDKYTKNRDYENSKEFQSKSYYAKGDRTDDAAVKAEKGKNNNVSAKTEKPALAKNFSKQRNLAVVKADNRAEEIDDEVVKKEESHKLAVLRTDRKKPKGNPNKMKRDRENEIKFAKIKSDETTDDEITSDTASRKIIRKNKKSKFEETLIDVKFDEDFKTSNNGSSNDDWFIESVVESFENISVTDRESDKENDVKSYRDTNERVERDKGKCATEYRCDTNERVERHKGKSATEYHRGTKGGVIRDEAKYKQRDTVTGIKNRKDSNGSCDKGDTVKQAKETRDTENYRDAVS